MLPIKSIKLKNFKSYKEQSFDLSGLNVFCGNNSVGKSTVMQAIGMVLQSDFGSKNDIKLNGELINIGRIDDIINDFISDDDQLKITLSVKECEVSWGLHKRTQQIFVMNFHVFQVWIALKKLKTL